MIYPIHIYGSSVLRGEAKEVVADFPGLKQFIADMFETMYAADGVGLAAPQVGKDLRIFVVDASGFAKVDPAAAGYKRAFINAEIYEESDEEILMNEGCLSVPGIHEDVYRPERIRIRYFDEDLNEHDEELDGWRARAVQHEYDHTEGTLFTDRLSPLRRTLLKGKLSGMSKGKYDASYRTKLAK